MLISTDLLKEHSEQVQKMFLYYVQLMHETVNFWKLQKSFDVHTEGHCTRVLLYALLIGEKRKLLLRSMIALCHASIFHDSRRKDDFMDKGHGDRAAEYYTEYCALHDIKYLPEVFATIKFHDQDDSLGEAYIRKNAKPDDVEGWLEVYRDFKDADALDRFRLGPWAIDERFLRTEQAKSLIDYAQMLVMATIDRKTLKETMAATRPFADKFSNKGEM